MSDAIQDAHMTTSDRFASKSALLAERIQTADVDLPGVGRVTVRGLSRAELLLAGKTGGEDVATTERVMLSLGMVSPKLTQSEVEKWQRVSPAGEIMPVVEEINRLSGIGKRVQREAYETFRDES